jgi:hypothetical protein
MLYEVGSSVKCQKNSKARKALTALLSPMSAKNLDTLGIEPRAASTSSITIAREVANEA